MDSSENTPIYPPTSCRKASRCRTLSIARHLCGKQTSCQIWKQAKMWWLWRIATASKASWSWLMGLVQRICSRYGLLDLLFFSIRICTIVWRMSICRCVYPLRSHRKLIISSSLFLFATSLLPLCCPTLLLYFLSLLFSTIPSIWFLFLGGRPQRHSPGVQVRHEHEAHQARTRCLAAQWRLARQKGKGRLFIFVGVFCMSS